MKKVLIGLAVFLLVSGSANAHNGFTSFMPTIPDPTAIVLDAEDDDWGWYDTANFAVLPEMVYSGLGESQDLGTNPNPEDFSASWFTAWSPPPDNALYVFFRAQDDTLRAQEAKGDWWNDDALIIGMDVDHAGGDYTSEFEHGYRLSAQPLFTREVGIEGPPYDGSELSSWPTSPPYAWGSSSVLPAGSAHLAANVKYTIELRLHPFDVLDQFNEENSTIHVFAAEQVIHFNVTFTDADRQEHGQQDIWLQDGANYLGGQYGDDAFDYLCVDTLSDDERANYGVWPGEDGATAVETTTWARIKAYTSH